ncbi:MAG: EB domain-containing protein [Thermomicrobiales bacterium]
MEARSFDQEIKELAVEGNRRKALRALALAAAGFGLARVAARAAEVEPEVALGKACQRNNQCSTDAKCRNGICTCASGYRECKGRCTDLHTNNSHCGRCGRGCGKNNTCVHGRCRPVVV